MPSTKASDDELADFVELLSWTYGFASATDVIRYLGIASDNIDDNGEEFKGCEDEEDEHQVALESVFTVIGDRIRICGDSYPFHLDESGTVLRFHGVDGIAGRQLYLYLLCATRLNMITNKVLDGVDGTLLMEDVSAATMKSYLGGDVAHSMVFGTAGTGGFEDRVTRFIKEIKEPCRFESIDGEDVPVRAQDGGVDVVGWIPFSDDAPGKLSVFAQVKTGTNWRRHLSDCNPEQFMRKWFSHQTLVPPVKAFFVAESVRRDGTWNSTNSDAGIFFDRCRISAFEGFEDFQRLGDLQNWLASAETIVTEAMRSE